MAKLPEDYLKEPYSRILIPCEGSYTAEILEFPGCISQGDTPNEAMANLEETALTWIQVSLDQGLEIPEPFLNQGYGGKIALRIPRSLHHQAVQFAERDGVSLNQFLLSAIAARIGAEGMYSAILNKFDCFMREAMTSEHFIHFEVETQVSSNPDTIGKIPIENVPLFEGLRFRE